jgi:hypothetical protein
MSGLPTIPELWEKLPKPLQWTIMLSTGAAIFVALLMLVWLVWGSGFIHEKLGITKQDLIDQTELLQQDQNDLVRNAVDTAIDEYDSRLMLYLSEKESDARKTILEPILKGMEALERNQQLLMRSQNNTNQEVRDMPKVFDQKLDRLIEESKRNEERQRERELLEELLRRAKEREGELEQPTPPRPGKKSTIRL